MTPAERYRKGAKREAERSERLAREGDVQGALKALVEAYKLRGRALKWESERCQRRIMELEGRASA